MALKDKMITLGGLDYFNKNVALPHNESITAMANALFALKDVVEDMETRLTTVENFSGSSAELASMFEIGLDDVYHVTDESVAPTIIANSINADGFAVPIGTSGIAYAKPTIQIPPLTWSDNVDDNYDFTATGVVKVWFGQAGAISKTVTFKKPGPGKISAAKLDSANDSIDTGIAADYSYTLHAKGFGESSTSVLIGGYLSNAARTNLRILPSSNKLQTQWVNNTEYTNAATGVQVTSAFEYWQKAGYLRLVQGNIDITLNPSGNTDTGNPGTNLYLFGDDATSMRGYGTLIFAEILDSNGVQIAYYAPYKLDATGEIVILNTSGITAQQIYDIVENGDNAEMASRILRPIRGSTLIEV